MVWTAAPMSPSRRAGRASAKPAQRARSVASISFEASGDGSPTGTVTAESAWKPSTTAPTSSFTRSPSFSARVPGMPCTISSFTEVQIVAGNPR